MPRKRREHTTGKSEEGHSGPSFLGSLSPSHTFRTWLVPNIQRLGSMADTMSPRCPSEQPETFDGGRRLGFLASMYRFRSAPERMKTQSVQATASQIAIFAAVAMGGRGHRGLFFLARFIRHQISLRLKVPGPIQDKISAQNRDTQRTKVFSGMLRNPRVGLVRRCLARSGPKTARRSRAAEENTTQGGWLIAIGRRGGQPKPFRSSLAMRASKIQL